MQAAFARQVRCARCGKPFTGPDDRRAQLRGGDLCRTCHLDPRARALPLETDLGKGWLGRCVRTLVQIFTRPEASFRMVEEPVGHARVLAFLATLRLPLWLLAVVWVGWPYMVELGAWIVGKELSFVDLVGVSGELKRPSVIGNVIGAQFADALRIWLLLLVPLGLPMLYFFGGILAHAGMALTGGARRSIGASMRAYGLALAPSLVLVGLLDFLLVVFDLPPELWLDVLAFAGVSALILLAIALARTHVTSVFRGLLVALVPTLVFVALTGGRGLLEHSRLPFMEAPKVDNYAPYPIE